MVIVALHRPYNFLLTIKEQQEKGMVLFVIGHTITFPQTQAVAEGDFSHLSHLFNHPERVKNFLRVHLLGPEGKIDALEKRLLGSKELLYRPRVLLAWLHLFRVGNPDVWEQPLAYLDVSEGNMLRLRGLEKELCDPNERSTDMSGFGLDVANRVRSDVAGVRQVGMPPAIDSSGMPLPEGGEGNAVGKGEGSGGSGEGDGSAAESGEAVGSEGAAAAPGRASGGAAQASPSSEPGEAMGSEGDAAVPAGNPVHRQWQWRILRACPRGNKTSGIPERACCGMLERAEGCQSVLLCVCC